MTNSDETLSLAAPAQDSPSHILNSLNDDCLRELFESPVLGMLDLWSIANVCRRFHPIATKVFETKYKNFENFPTEIIYSNWPFAEFLQTFGAFIEGFGPVRLNDEECVLASEHCTNLKYLKCMIREQDSVDRLHRLFGRLEKLEILMRSSVMSLLDCFDETVQLKSLTVTYPDAFRSFHMKLPKRNLPALTELNICYAISGNEDFFSHNPQLQKLSLITRTIGRYFDYGCFSSLRNLRTLQVYDINEDDDTIRLLSTIVDQNIPLEQLLIDYYDYGTDAHLIRIGQIRTIKQLSIKSLRFNEHAIRLAENLSDLEAVEFWSHSHEFGISGLRAFMEKASDSLTKVKYVYRLKREDCDAPPDEFEFNRMAAIARRRRIDLRMNILLQSYYNDDDGQLMVDYEADVSVRSIMANIFC